MISGVGNAWADEVTFAYGDYKGNGTQSTGSQYTMEKTNVVAITNTKFYGNNSYAHFYADGTTTVTPASGVTITEIVLTASATKYNGFQSSGTITASTGEISGNTSSTTVTWTGSATSAFTITNNKQIRWTSIVVTYSTSGGSSLTDNDLALTGAPISLSFDLYNSSSAQVVNYTTSSTGKVTVSASEYVKTAVDEENQTITVTPLKKTSGAVEITVSQAADGTYAAGSATFTVDITDSTPIPTHHVTFSINGETSSNEVEEGADIVFPDDPSDISGKTFMGWTTEAINGTADEAPEFVTSAVMGQNDVTFYAVFATVEESGNSLQKMQSGDTFVAGDKIVVVAVDGNNKYGMYQETQSNSYVKYYLFSEDYNTIILDDKNWWTVSSGSDGTWKLGDSTNGYLYNSGSNNLSVDKSNATEWTLEDNGNGTFSLMGSRYLSCRTDLSGSNTNLYRMAGGTPAGIYSFSIYKLSDGISYSEYCTTVVAAVVEKPVIKFAENPFLFSTTATITCATEGATIKYSFDGENWNDYSEALTITATTTIHAKATKGNDESNIATATVTKNLAEPTVAISGDLTVDLNGETNVEAGTLTAAVTYNETAVDGATVTWSGDNDDVATINATGAVTIKSRGTVTFTATYAGNSDYAEATATKTITVTDSKVPGTEGRPYTVAEAIEAIDNDGDVNGVYVKGVISQIDSYYSNYKSITYWISEDGTTENQFEVYSGKGLNGADFSSKEDLQLGDVVVVRGNIVLYGASTYEFSAGSQLVSLTRKGDAGLSYETTAYYVTVGGTFNTPALTNPHDLTVTYSSSDTEVATVNAETGVVTLGSKVGTTTITASFVGNGEYNAASASYTLTVEYPATTTTLNETAVELDLADDVPTATLVATVKKGEEVIENATITWTSDDEEVATVDNSGVVTAVAKGTATITATFTADGYKTSSATCEVTVINSASGVIDLAKTGTITFNDFSGLGGSYTSEDPCTIGGFDWKVENCLSSKGLQLKASTGKVTSPTIKSKQGFVVSVVMDVNTVIISDGTNSSEEGTLTVNDTSAKLTFSAGSKYAKITSITFTPIKDNRTLAFSEPTTEILVNGTATNAATATPAGTITYTSSDEEVATVDAEGKVTGVKIGTATITATVAEDADYNEATASYKVTVNGIPAATDIALTATDDKDAPVVLSEMKVGTIGTFVATYTKAATDVTVTYTSDATDVLTIAADVFEAVKGGTANVTVTITPDDADHYVAVSKEFEVTVLNVQKGTTVLTLYDGELEETAAGSTLYGTNISLIAELANQYDGEVTASLTNDAIATVAVEGENITITPKAVGTTIITFTAPETANFEGEVSKTYALTVTAPEGRTACVFTPAEVVLNETFNGCDGTGGNDGKFGTASTTEINTPNTITDIEGWTLTKAYEASGCVKLGSSKEAGSATTPLLSVSAGKTYTLTFNAAPWSDDSATMTVSVTGGTINGEGTVTTATMTTGEWNSFEYNILATAAEMTIKFTCSQTRFFLDDVKVEIPEVAPAIPDVTIAESRYASFCCEYPLDFSEANENYKAWYVSEVSGTTVTFKQIKGKIAGGVPFFLYGEPGTYHLQVAAESTETLSGNMLVGTLAPTYVESVVGDYTNFGLSAGSFKKMNNGVVKANKAYLPILTDNIPAGARLNIIFDEEDTPTGISSVNNENLNQRKDVYNLNGQRVENMKKGGLYIVNGKKVFMKGQR